MTECKSMKPLNTLFIDNFDSFVFNLVDEFAKRNCPVQVWRNDVSVEKALELARNLPRPRLVVLSPGPGIPARAGCCVEFVRRAPKDLPILGICLGHQSIVEAFGGIVVRAPEIVHGKASMITHVGTGIFEGLPSPMSVGRYHSLITDRIPEELKITASLGDMTMGIEHVDRPVAGLQFHPESILTPQGGKLLENVFPWAGGRGEE
jgi:anthranilate synthase/aminodeoxychorismate synthase-like glutamine amidotransferase